MINFTVREWMQIIALGFLGTAGILWLIRGDSTNAAWALGALVGYAFKNGVLKEVSK